ADARQPEQTPFPPAPAAVEADLQPSRSDEPAEPVPATARKSDEPEPASREQVLREPDPPGRTTIPPIIDADRGPLKRVKGSTPGAGGGGSDGGRSGGGGGGGSGGSGTFHKRTS